MLELPSKNDVSRTNSTSFSLGINSSSESILIAVFCKYSALMELPKLTVFPFSVNGISLVTPGIPGIKSSRSDTSIFFT